MNSVHALVVNGDGEFPRYESLDELIHFRSRDAASVLKHDYFGKMMK